MLGKPLLLTYTVPYLAGLCLLGLQLVLGQHHCDLFEKPYGVQSYQPTQRKYKNIVNHLNTRTHTTVCELTLT